MGATDVPHQPNPGESPMHTIQDLALGDIGDIGFEARRLRKEVSALQLAVRPLAVAIAREWEALDSNIQQSLDRLLVSTAPADLKAIVDVLHGLYHDMADIFAAMNIDHDLPPPRAADLMSEWRYWPPVSHDPNSSETASAGDDRVVAQIV